MGKLSTSLLTRTRLSRPLALCLTRPVSTSEKVLKILVTIEYGNLLSQLGHQVARPFLNGH